MPIVIFVAIRGSTTIVGSCSTIMKMIALQHRAVAVLRSGAQILCALMNQGLEAGGDQHGGVGSRSGFVLAVNGEERPGATFRFQLKVLVFLSGT
jgi:hypothetical protein